MTPLFVLLAVGAFLVGIRTWQVHFRRKLNHLTFTKQIVKLLRANNHDRALKLCDAVDRPVTRAVRNALLRYKEADDAALLAAAASESSGTMVGVAMSATGALNALAAAAGGASSGTQGDIHTVVLGVGLLIAAIALWTEVTDARIRRGVLQATEETLKALRS